MIGKPEIIRIAGQLNLNPHIVEKDYALGWLLAGIFANEKIGDSWVFKGGTCLKKCFFETYRSLLVRGSSRATIRAWKISDETLLIHGTNPRGVRS